MWNQFFSTTSFSLYPVAVSKAELQKTINDMTAKLEEAQRKAAQGSPARRGESLERVIEEQLRTAFPRDLVQPIKNGTRGVMYFSGS